MTSDRSEPLRERRWRSTRGQAAYPAYQPAYPHRPPDAVAGAIAVRGAGASALRQVVASAYRWRYAAAVFLVALTARLAAAVLSGGTFDPDEFVLIALGRAVAHGAVPYRDITYYHPPGMLYFVAPLELVMRWWPASRIAVLAVDSVTAVLVWHIGRQLYAEWTARIAGFLYGVSPLALISATRVGPDPIITALGMFGLALLLRRESRSGPILAGACLALAVWTKYPSLLFLPVYVLAAPRYARRMVTAFGLTALALFTPFLPEARGLFADTVAWQLAHREGADLLHRVGGVSTYWLGLNCLGAIGLLRGRHPRWLQVGFLAGGLFLLTSQAYYHYFVPTVPFAALLAAPVIQPFVVRWRHAFASAAIGMTLLWSIDVGFGPPAARLCISASRLSSVQTTVTAIEHATPDDSTILTDEFEYSLLADRRDAREYFWNMEGSVSASGLETQLSNVKAVVETAGTSGTYPKGFIDYVEDLKARRIRAGGAVVWVLPARGAD